MHNRGIVYLPHLYYIRVIEGVLFSKSVSAHDRVVDIDSSTEQ